MVKRSTGVSLMDLQAWACKFETGWDYFGDLGALVPFGQREPSEKQYRDAWAALGAAYLERFNPERMPEAEKRFGRPWKRSRSKRAAT